MNADEFLAHVREAAHAGRTHRVHTQDISPAVGYVGGGDDLPARLAAEIDAVGGQAHLVANRDGARDVLRQLLAEHRPAAALCWQHPLLEELRLAELLANAGVEPLAHAQLAALDESQRRERLLAAGLGVSSARWAVAETGTVALDAQPGHERLASLLPPVYVTIVEEPQIVPDLFDLFDRLEQSGLDNLPSNLALVTGPSKTGDIELTLTTGVHGPGTWHVVIIRRNSH